jgi:hypothetical protein
MLAAASAHPPLSREQLAQAIDQYGHAALQLVSEALRQDDRSSAPAGSNPPGPTPSIPSAAIGRLEPWRQVDVIEGFEHRWPEVHEHYGPMAVFESRDEQGPVRFAVGQPRERLTLYGRERGWVSIWEVINGQPREQRANFIETDNFETTGERIAHISGKGGNRMAGFLPEEEHLLPPVYRSMKIEVQRDRMQGAYAKNRLGVVATSEDTDPMLDHALAHLRLRS